MAVALYFPHDSGSWFVFISERLSLGDLKLFLDIGLQLLNERRHFCIEFELLCGLEAANDDKDD